MSNNDFIFGTDFFELEESEQLEAQKLQLREGELREVAVLFADIKGFSSISNLFDAETIHKKMDEIMKIFTKCIVFYGGVVDKYMGDGIMALFGAKRASEQDTERAVHAAIKMQQQLKLYNSLLSRQTGFESLELGVRIGINAGLVSVGKVGESSEFTVYGPEVNLASRMESNAPVNRIMMPYSTKRLIERNFEFEFAGNVTVKGFADPIESWLVIGPKLDSSLHRRNQEIKYIGRSTELNLLQKSLQGCLSECENKHSGKLPSVSIKGEAGLGKTRLVYEFEKANQESVRFLHGASSAVSPAPLNLFTSMFESLFRIQVNQDLSIKKDKIDKAFNDLVRVTPQQYISVLLDIKPLIAYLLEIRLPDDRLKQSGADLLSHLSKAIEQFLLIYIHNSLADKKPIVLVLDDLHWIDEASTKVLENLINTISRDRDIKNILFVFMHRTDYVLPLFVDLILCHTCIELSPLSSEEIRELIAEYTIGRIIPDETINKVIELSEGNPFFLEEWCNYIDEIPEEDTRDFPVPVNLHTLILTRLDKLSPNLRMLLHKASVIGQEFFVDILRFIESRLHDPIDVDSTLEGLERHSLILRMLGFEYSTYFFKHITTREVAYQTLLLENRKMLHQLTGEAIEEIFHDRLDEFSFSLAEHYSKSDNTDKAIHYLEIAAQQSAKLYNNKQAVTLYNQLLSIIPQNQLLLNLNVRFKIAEINWLIGNWKESISEVEIILPLSISNDFTELVFESNRFLGIAAFYKGDIQSAYDKLATCLGIAESMGNDRLICIANSNMGNWYFQNKDYARAKELQTTSLELAKALDDVQRQAKTLSNLGLIELAETNYQNAESLFQQSLEIALENRYLKEQSIALGNLGYVKIKQELFKEAIPYLKQKLDLAESMNDKLEILKALGNLSNVYRAMDDFDAAIESLNQIVQIRTYLGDQKGIDLVMNEIEEINRIKNSL